MDSLSPHLLLEQFQMPRIRNQVWCNSVKIFALAPVLQKETQRALDMSTPAA